MKRCPECRRDYYDETLLYCLDDGTALLDGPASSSGALGEAVTAIIHNVGDIGDAPTLAHTHTTEQTAVLPPSELGGSSNRPVERQASFANRSIKILGVAAAAALISVSVFLGYREFKSTAGEPINSIAVLPFQNKGGDPNSDYLSDGLAESLIYRLSQLPNLKVSPTSSVVQYKGKDTKVAAIASELGVDAVLTGRVAQIGDSLTISIELVDVRNNKLLWGEQYERKMSDLLATQREITGEIVSKLKLKLSGEGEQRMAKKYTDNNEAYQLYLKGRFHFAKRGKDDLLRSIEYFQQAIELDPNFALAYVGVSYSYNTAAANGNISPGEAVPKARSAVQHALELDPSLAEAHAALANSLAFDWNWSEAQREYTRALELDPNSAEIHYRYALSYLTPMARTRESVAEIKRALELEPLSLAIGANLAGAYLRDHQFDLALQQAEKTYNLDPNHPATRGWLVHVYVATGRYEDAIILSEKILQLAPGDMDVLSDVGYAYAKSGRHREAEEILGKFNDLAKTKYVGHYFKTRVLAGLDKRDEAIAELERSVEDHDPGLAQAMFDPLVEPFRDEPRFKELLKRMNLPE